MFDKYYFFRKMLDAVADECLIVDADMCNYAGDIEITGKDADGVTISMRISIKEDDKEVAENA